MNSEDPLDVIKRKKADRIKSFLEHLEDLRWVLIKSLATIGVAMIICFSEATTYSNLNYRFSSAD